MRIPRPWRDPLAAGRLLLLSTFPDSLRRPTAATASQRNARVAALAHVVTGKLDVRAAAERISMATS